MGLSASCSPSVWRPPFPWGPSCFRGVTRFSSAALSSPGSVHLCPRGTLSEPSCFAPNFYRAFSEGLWWKVVEWMVTLHLAGIPWDSKLVAVFTWPLKVSSSSLYPVSGSFLYILLLSRMKTTVGLSSGGTQNFLDLNSLRFLCTLKVEFIFKCMIL